MSGVAALNRYAAARTLRSVEVPVLTGPKTAHAACIRCVDGCVRRLLRCASSFRQPLARSDASIAPLRAGEGIEDADATCSSGRSEPADYCPCPLGTKLRSGRYRAKKFSSLAMVLSSALMIEWAAAAP
jgi:hypothetical protein